MNLGRLLANRRHALAALLALSTFGQSALAASGNDLKRYADGDSTDQIIFTMYLIGFRDALSISKWAIERDPANAAAAKAQMQFLPCIPTEVTGRQLAAVVRKNFAQRPEETHQDAFVFVVTAFQDAWPCSRP